MKIKFNLLGAVIETVTDDESLRQGNIGNTITATFEGRNNLNYIATLNFTRPDGEIVQDVIMNADDTIATDYKFTFSEGYFFSEYGKTTITVFLRASDGSVLASGTITFNIEQTDFTNEVPVDRDQFEQLFAKIQKNKEDIENINVNRAKANVEEPVEKDLDNLKVDGVVYDVITHDEVDKALEKKADLVDGKVPSNQLPVGFDDMVEGKLLDSKRFQLTDGTIVTEGSPELKTRIYVDSETNKTYRWSGTEFVLYGTSIELGETEGTAYEGSKGKQNATDINTLKTDKLDSKGLFLTSSELTTIVDKKTFYKFFFAKRAETRNGYLIEGGTEQAETNESVINALGGLPVGFKRPTHWFLAVNKVIHTDKSYDNGFTLELFLRGSVDTDFYKMFIHSYNGGNGTYDTGWLNLKEIGDVTVDNLEKKIKGDETVVVDRNQAGNGLEVHLDKTFEESLATKTELDKKVQKSGEQKIVYGTDGLGTQTTLQYNKDPYGNGLVQREQDGRVKGTTATEDNDLTTFKQVRDIAMLSYNYRGDIYEPEFFNYCQNTPGVVDGAWFSVEVQTDTPQEALNRGFPALETGAIVYGFFYNGLMDSPIVIMTDKGNYKIIDGGTLTCEKLGGGDVTANNGEPTTADLDTLKVGDTNYKIQSNVNMTFSDVEDTSATNELKTISIAHDGTVDKWKLGGGGGGSLPIASSTQLGGIKVGGGLSITADGTLSSTAGGSRTTIWSGNSSIVSINGNQWDMLVNAKRVILTFINGTDEYEIPLDCYRDTVREFYNIVYIGIWADNISLNYVDIYIPAQKPINELATIFTFKNNTSKRKWSSMSTKETIDKNIIKIEIE